LSSNRMGSFTGCFLSQCSLSARRVRERPLSLVANATRQCLGVTLPFRQFHACSAPRARTGRTPLPDQDRGSSTSFLKAGALGRAGEVLEFPRSAPADCPCRQPTRGACAFG